MRAVYRLLALVRRHGAAPVDAACAKTLALDVVDVTRVARILHAGPAGGAVTDELVKIFVCEGSVP